MTEDRAREAVEHLQQAATQMIEAARAVLDLAEELVHDPGPLLAAASALADAAGRARRPAAAPEPGRSSTVQHIRVS